VPSPLLRPDGVALQWEEQGQGSLVVIVHQLLLAVVEAAGGGAIAIAVGYGYNIAARVAAARPDAISDLVCVQPAAAAILPRSELRQADVMGGSDSVAEMLTQLMRTDQRAAVRTLLGAVNPPPERGRAARAGVGRRVLRLAGVDRAADRGVGGR
jgi:pimeloyl-ACP methyl ester carboxylesterase